MEDRGTSKMCLQEEDRVFKDAVHRNWKPGEFILKRNRGQHITIITTHCN